MHRAQWIGAMNHDKSQQPLTVSLDYLGITPRIEGMTILYLALSLTSLAPHCNAPRSVAEKKSRPLSSARACASRACSLASQEERQEIHARDVHAWSVDASTCRTQVCMVVCWTRCFQRGAKIDSSITHRRERRLLAVDESTGLIINER